MEDTNLIEIKNITKSFPGVVALNRVNLAIRKGEVHILVGENGAGKSSLVKVLCGIYRPDTGEILYEGKSFSPQSPLVAIEAGIRVVYQEFNLLSYLSVAENIFFERLPRRYGLVDYQKLYRDTEKILEEVGLEISPKTRVEELGVAQMQLIEIAKALSADSRVLIMDEPTATLTPKEITRLFEIIRRLKEKGVTIIYISHRLQEIFQIGDRVTVLRNGVVVTTLPIQETNVAQLVRQMVGRSIDEEYPFLAECEVGEEVFQVKDLRYQYGMEGINFAAHRGELLGIAGLVGSGRTETMRAIFGADAKLSGEITVNGREVNIKNPVDAVRNGISLLTEDRKSQGLILDMPCYSNITLTDLARISRFGLMNHSEERAIAKKLISDLGIRTPSEAQTVGNLSGGNQQKVVLAKWLFCNTDVLIFDEPTRGIDVGAKFEIYMLLWRLAQMGKAIIIVSSDLPELMGICHRILVFSKAKIAGEVKRCDFNQETILSLAYQEYIKERVS